MLKIAQKRDGTFEVLVPWFGDEEALHELELLIGAAAQREGVIRVCRDRDRAGNLRPVKALLSIDPSDDQSVMRLARDEVTRHAFQLSGCLGLV
jgi:hypothetical protein